MKTSRTLIVAFIIAFGLLQRVYKIDLPLVDFYPTRQIQTANITKNLIEDKFNFLYPRVDYYGPQHKYYLIEFPGYNLVVAYLSTILGSFGDWQGRIVSIASYAFATLFLFLLISKLLGKTIATYSVAFFTFSPLSVLTSRAFQPDEMMLFSAIASLYFLHKWLLANKFIYLLVAAVLFSWAVLLKITAAVFLFPVFYYIFFQKDRKIVNFKFFFFLILSFVPAFLWYRHSYIFSVKIDSFFASDYRLVNWFDPSLYVSYPYYSNIFGFELNLVLLPIGLLLLTLGLLLKPKKNFGFIYSWLSGVILYFVVFNRHVMSHEYYHLPFLPIASIFMAIASESIINMVVSSRTAVIRNRIFATTLFFFIYLISTLPITMQRAYRPIERFSFVKDAAGSLEKLTKPDDLIVGSMDGGPALVYYSNRKGWSFNVDREKIKEHFEFIKIEDTQVSSAIEELEDRRRLGAKVFASGNKSQFISNKFFSEYMYSNYKVLEDNDKFIIFDLSK
ncbi:glycosyltransferase family 39 protein [Candidatus Curtissbacteria bacterium]|nr:glycosyltransferase family 39 protein [Candidatus Curtissbacteria bacterium]